MTEPKNVNELLYELRRLEADNARYKKALQKLASAMPVCVNGNMQGQSDVRMQYAAMVLSGGRP